MSAKSPRESQAERTMAQYNRLYGQIKGDKAYDIFDSGPKYGLEDYESKADALLSQGIDTLTRNAQNAANQTARATTQSLASQGITGGSVLSNAQTKARVGVMDNYLDEINKLNLSRLQQELSILDKANLNDLRWKQSAFNAANSQYGNLARLLGGETALLGNYDDTTWVDDLLTGLKLSADIAGSVAKAST